MTPNIKAIRAAAEAATQSEWVVNRCDTRFAIVSPSERKAVNVRKSNVCDVCNTADCPKLNSITYKGGKYRKVGCDRCIANLEHPFIRAALREGSLSAPKVLTTRAGSGCPSDCKTARTGGCSVATRATATAQLLAELEN